MPDGRSPVIVFECKGGAEGALGVVRTLGRRGIDVTVVTDDDRSLASRSRYCRRAFYRPGYAARSEETIDFLAGLARELGARPVAFPTADPDLLFLSAARARLAPHVRLFVAAPEIVQGLSDKRRFIAFARRYDIPVPPTWAPADAAEARVAGREARYPVVLKPSHPAAWTHAGLQARIGARKAWIVRDLPELMQAYETVAPYSTDLLIQGCIVGPDDAHYSLHAYFDRASNPVAWFTGRKLRIYPPHAGSGCFVASVYVQPMVDIGLEALRRMRYTGIAVLNFKQDARSGDFVVHEINPRVSQWNLLATRCGVDLPYMAYADAAGEAYPPPSRQREGIRYVNLRADLKAMATYRQSGEWRWGAWLRSFAAPLVHQVFALDDLGVLAASLRDALRARRTPAAPAAAPSDPAPAADRGCRSPESELTHVP